MDEITLTPAADGTTRFGLREEYSGPLLSMMWRSMVMTLLWTKGNGNYN